MSNKSLDVMAYEVARTIGWPSLDESWQPGRYYRQFRVSRAPMSPSDCTLQAREFASEAIRMPEGDDKVLPVPTGALGIRHECPRGVLRVVLVAPDQLRVDLLVKHGAAA